jgi:MioC protein
MLEINILIGTMTGNAQMVAQEIELSYGDDDTKINLFPMDKLDSSVFDNSGHFLICTSTYGQGDVPDNARDFFDALSIDAPDLSKVRYGILGLGDRTYQDTFNAAGKKFETLFTQLGAQLIGERGTLDAADGELPEDQGVEWMASWLEVARNTAAA